MQPQIPIYASWYSIPFKVIDLFHCGIVSQLHSKLHLAPSGGVASHFIRRYTPSLDITFNIGVVGELVIVAGSDAVKSVVG